LEWRNDLANEEIRDILYRTLGLLNRLLGDRAGKVQRDARGATGRLRGGVAKAIDKREKTTNISKGWEAAAYLRPKGTVLGRVRMKKSKDPEDAREFGFIQSEDGQEFYFSPRTLENLRWEEVAEGMVVTFVVGRKPSAGKAAEAIRVRVAQRPAGDS